MTNLTDSQINKAINQLRVIEQAMRKENRVLFARVCEEAQMVIKKLKGDNDE